MIYKLKYSSREVGISNLIAKGVIQVNNNEIYYSDNTLSLVEIGEIEGVSGYHFDLMSLVEIDFGSNEIHVNNPKHSFAI